MKKTIYLAAIAIIAASCSGGEQGHYDGSASALMERMQQSVEKGIIMYGHQDDLMYGHSWKLEADDSTYLRSDVKEVSGMYPAVYGLDLGGIELGNESNLDNNPFAAMRATALAHHLRGGIVTFSWHPRNPFTEGDAWDVTSTETVASVLPGGQCHGLFKEWLCRVADYFDTFRTDDGQLIPIIFRPWHEHTGSWFWWGRDLCTAEQYKALWKMTFDYLSTERGLHNLIWSYSPGAGGITEELYMERWPGDEMVDMIGVDCYQYNTAEDFTAELRNALDIMLKLGKEHGKLIAVTEAGYESLVQSDWWTGCLYPAIKDYPLVYVLTWRNACDNPTHFYAPYPGQASAEDFRTFASFEGAAMIE